MTINSYLSILNNEAYKLTLNETFDYERFILVT